ncbi:pre-mRNA-processing factor 40 homolog B-like [Sycon ciliatum]|uniref:pre-mRNA-processing factor 40 homolog B-like n=1 Tax=Sycon ciliatum TaxID=27933 RepID=UPI0020AEE463|eukprot:scpid29236/ scgid14867/ Pre-mRNA-processing factor 40 homolog A; Fas ligand-associated factor 1; Formin-binding protein 11; Formin-binding protein 3; Huntingtin yeast partner A; Huntingtin-interacting protein 10; Huntingtin-interacting protein A; Renal carcinoma antigen NY-REN-6
MANTGPPPGGRPPLMMGPPFSMPPYGSAPLPAGGMPPHPMSMQMPPMGVPPGQPMPMPPQQPPQPGMMVNQQPGMFPPAGAMPGMPMRPPQPMAAAPQTGGAPTSMAPPIGMPMQQFQPAMQNASTATVMSSAPAMATSAPQMMQPPPQPIAMAPPASAMAMPGAVPIPASMPPTMTMQPPVVAGVAQAVVHESSPAPTSEATAAAEEKKKKKAAKVKKKKEKEKASSKASVWTEHKAPDGRTYFYNAETKQSSWSKPDDLKSKSELLLSQSPWKEHKTSDQRIYYYNPETKESVWTIPKEFAELKAKAAALEEEEAEEGKSDADSSSSSEDESDEETKPEAQAADNTVVVAEVAGVSKVHINEVEPQIAPVVVPVKEVVYNSREEARDAFKQLLREKSISSTMTWEQALKIVITDPRFTALRKLAEKKQVFNNYKAQRAKEEKEENRQKAKKAREDLLDFIQQHPKVFSVMRYRLAADLFEGDPTWDAVANETDRKNLFEDALFYVAKREKDEEAKRREYHREILADIYRSMQSITYKTVWAKAQVLLEENSDFASNDELDDMDKEDALIVFENHVRELCKEHEEEKVSEQVQEHHDQRKNRDNMLQLLDELHEVSKLHSMSQWCDLYPMICEDPRYENMLGQPGSTPLDLFKFYVDDLRQRLPDEKKIIKDILKDASFSVDIQSSFDDVKAVIYADQRSENLDKGNIRLTFNALLEKAEARERELAKMEERKVRKRETAFKAMLKMAAPPLDANSTWEKCRSQFEVEDAFSEVAEESERTRLFREFISSIAPPPEESDDDKKHKRKSSHHRSSKKHSRKHRRSRSQSESSLSEGEYRDSHSKSERSDKKRKRSRSPSVSDSDSERESRRRRHKNKKSRKRKHHASSGSDSDYHRHKAGHKDERSSRGDRTRAENGDKKKAKRASSHQRGSSESEGELETRRKMLLQQLSGD